MCIRDRPNVCELIDLPGVRLYPIGRLDYQTTGLLLLTNDGELAYAMTHPKHHVAKVYHGILKGMVQQEDIEKLRAGVTLEDGYVTRPAQAKYLGAAGSHSRVEITVYEGKNHQVRRMARAIGHPVLKLRRVAVGLSLIHIFRTDPAMALTLPIRPPLWRYSRVSPVN